MLPPEFREVVGGEAEQSRLMITNFDGCVAGYTIPEWERIEESFNQINMLDSKLRNFQRFFISGATEVGLDKQGRILIPPHLREYADLKKDVVMAGVGRKLEIWDRERFEAQRVSMEQDFDQVMDSLVQNGFELRI